MFVVLVTTAILSVNIITTDYSIKYMYFLNTSGDMRLLNFPCSDLALCD